MIKRFFIVLAIVLLAASSWAAEVTLVWDAPYEGCKVKNYKIYYGTIPARPSKILVVGDQLTATVTGLTAGEVYYFKATAVHLDGKESSFSNEVSKAVPFEPGPKNLTEGE